jgi:hypothetical protein
MGYTIIYEIFKDNGVGEDAGLLIIPEVQKRGKQVAGFMSNKKKLDSTKQETDNHVSCEDYLKIAAGFHIPSK